MNLLKVKNQIKKLFPLFVRSYIAKKRMKINYEFANFILKSAKEYSSYLGGDVSSFDKNLTKIIVTPNNNCNSIVQDVLIAFMPDFEKNLYEFYKSQEYLIFYRFLCYPFIMNMDKYFVPFSVPLSRYKNNDVVDYGSGIPYGIINALLKKK